MLWWILISNKMTLIITISTAENIQAIIMVMVMMVKSDRSEVSRYLVCSLKMSHWAWVGGGDLKRLQKRLPPQLVIVISRGVLWEHSSTTLRIFSQGHLLVKLFCVTPTMVCHFDPGKISPTRLEICAFALNKIENGPKRT